MDYITLKAELTNDPLSRGYSGMTGTQVADSLNTRNRPKERTIVQGYEIIEATVPSEWSALTAAEKQRYQTIVSASGGINTKGTNTRAAFAAMFGAGTTTRSNLVALQDGPQISRAEELGLEFIFPGYIDQARAMS